MSRLQKVAQKLIPLILLIAVAIGSFCVYSNWQYKKGDNPLKNSVLEHLEQQNDVENKLLKPKKLKKTSKKEYEEIQEIYESQNTQDTPQEKTYFKTSIVDKETVFDNNYKFTITHLTKLEIKSVFVYVNKEKILQFNGNVLLKNGKNTIRIFARYIDENRKVISVFADYIVFCKTKNKEEKTTKNHELYINTDLENKTVYDEKFSFFAKLSDKNENSELSVVFNGKTITHNSENYSITLNIGSNTIRLKATDALKGEAATINQIYTIVYVPKANEQTEPKLQYINISNNQNIKGSDFLLNILAKDYNGKRIYKNGIQVKLNDVIFNNKWDSNYSVYKLSFADGKNIIDIRLTDRDGRFVDYSYTIYCQKAQNGERIGKINISVDAKVLGLGNLVSSQGFDIVQGKNGAQTVIEFLEENGFGYSNKGTVNDGFYLSRISKKGIAQNANIPKKLEEDILDTGLELNNNYSADSLGEQDFTYASGWMIKINGNFINYNLSDAVFKDGNTLEIRFTLAYGKDIGGYAYNGNGGNFDTLW